MKISNNAYALTILLVIFALFVATPAPSYAAWPAAQNGDTAVSQTDHAFVLALAKKDSASLDAKLEHRDYGQVVAILSAREKIHVLRVWVKRANNWRLLDYHEVSQAEQAQTSPGTGVKDCENPCKTVPFHPRNESEQAVIESWQALETGVTTHNADLWSDHVDDEFVTVSSSSDHPVFKSDRIATLNLQKQTGYGSAPAPLVSAQMFDFGNTIVMTCLHQPFKGKPVHVSRVWVKRKGKWLMAISFQTTVQEGAAKS
jgi:hypothetical protein